MKSRRSASGGKNGPPDHFGPNLSDVLDTYFKSISSKIRSLITAQNQ